MIVALDPATHTTQPALLYGWTGALGHKLLVADPAHPGAQTLGMSFTNGAPACAGAAVPCVLTGGLNYISASQWLDLQWPAVLNETMYKAWLPPASVGRTLAGSKAGGQAAAPGVMDTIFFGRDTGSVYTLIPSWPHQLPTGLANPSTVLRTQAWYQDAPGGSWSASTSGSSNNLEFLDAATLQISPTNAGVDRLFAVESRVVWPPPAGVSEGWNGFQLYRLIKYVPKLTGAYAPPGQQTDFTISTAGGPPLPDDYIRYVDYGDGSSSTWQHASNTTSNLYSDNRNRTARLAIIHPVTRDTVARASVILASLSVTPNPLTGKSDTDYTFTATYHRQLPPNPSWDWDFDDGRTRLDVSNKETIRYPNDFRKAVDTFDIKVTLRSAGQVVAKDSARVFIKMERPAWKFTSINVQFSTVETIAGYTQRLHQAVDFTSWKRDSTMLVRLMSGQNEGGLLHLNTQYTFPWPGVPTFQANPGIYLLEGTNLTSARLGTHLDFQPIGLTGGGPAAGRITNHWLVFGNYQFAQGPTTDGNLLVNYSETGTLTNGSIAGTAWGAAAATIGNTGWFPFNVRQANVSFTGNTASGTLTYLFRVWQGGGQCIGAGPTCKEAIRAVATLVFTADRVQ